MRAFFEYVVATVVGSFVVFAALVGYLQFMGSSQPNLPKESAAPEVLGEATEIEEPSYEIFDTNFGDETDEVEFTDEYVLEETISSQLLLTNVVSSDSFLLFDNTNLEQIEGNTEPNSAVRLELGGKVFSNISNSNGAFSIQLPRNLPPFIEGSLITLNKEKEELNRKDFTFILRQYLNRQYFLSETKDIVFSLDADDYTSVPTDTNVISNEQCYAEFQPYSEANEGSENILILPSSVEALESNRNGFVTFEITNLNEFYSLDYCLNQWEEIGETFRWHNAVLK